MAADAQGNVYISDVGASSGPPAAWTATVSAASSNWRSVSPASGTASASPGGGPAGLAIPRSPAAAGDRLVIYAEGLGPVTPEFAAGAVAPFDALCRTVNPVSVSIGGQPAVVEFAGLAPGSVAEYQLNVVVPAGIPPGDAAPLVISVAGATSPTATIVVR